LKNTKAKYAEKSFYGPIEVEEFKRDINKRKKWFDRLSFERKRLIREIKEVE
jgi:hypothetical protein